MKDSVYSHLENTKKVIDSSLQTLHNLTHRNSGTLLSLNGVARRIEGHNTGLPIDIGALQKHIDALEKNRQDNYNDFTFLTLQIKNLLESYESLVEQYNRS